MFHSSLKIRPRQQGQGLDFDDYIQSLVQYYTHNKHRGDNVREKGFTSWGLPEMSCKLHIG